MKILVVYKHNRSFVHKDIELLSKHYDVTPFFYSGFKCIRKLWSELRDTDIVFIWFASNHAFITTFLARRPKIVVTGGFDVAGEKEINYGLMLSPIFKRMVRYILKRAAKIISVSEFNKRELEKYLGMKDSVVIYNCADINRFKPDGKKEEMVLTVGNVNNETWIRKGISKFVETAQYFQLRGKPINFVVVGKIYDDAKEKVKRVLEKTSNITFTDFVLDEELLKYYQRAKVYCQLSYYESFGVAPAEAMLCECIPVVTNRGALPEVVGDFGYQVNYDNLSDIAKSIEKALKSKNGKKARERVLECYSPIKRERKLISLVEETKSE